MATDINCKLNSPFAVDVVLFGYSFVLGSIYNFVLVSNNIGWL